MTEPSLSAVKLNVHFDDRNIEDVLHPDFLMHEDAIKQYLGIWQIISHYVIFSQAKRVLEFGTREGYSTQLFSKVLRKTEGRLWTVDKDDHKIAPEIVKEMDNVTFIKQNVMDKNWIDTIGAGPNAGRGEPEFDLL